MAASTLLSNPNRHRAQITSGSSECEYKPGGEQQQTQRQQQKPRTLIRKKELTSVSCSYKTPLSSAILPAAVRRISLPQRIMASVLSGALKPLHGIRLFQ